MADRSWLVGQTEANLRVAEASLRAGTVRVHNFNLFMDGVTMANLYAQIGEPTQWCLIHQYADGSSVGSAWGPFADEKSAAEAQSKLQNVIDSPGDWSVVPLRRVVVEPASLAAKIPVLRSAVDDAQSTRE